MSLQSHRKTIPELVEECYLRTAEALSSSDLASDNDIFQSLNSVRESQKIGKSKDLLETLARTLGNQEEHLSAAIQSLGDAVAVTLNPIPAVIPFAGKLIAPSAFYESFELIHDLGKALLTPVLYAEDTDAIGTGSINPIAANILAEEIYYLVGQKFNIHPFLTCTRMDYESWAFLCRKHFEL